jgi:cytoskeletal protein CcmA (bactofilin family)
MPAATSKKSTPEALVSSLDGDGGASTERRHDASNPELSVYLGAESCIIGTLSMAGNLRLDGSLDGELLGAERVTLGPTARVKGRISGHTVIVLGATVDAQIQATAVIELRDGAVVKGDLRAPHVHMDPDIEFHGRCDMNPRTRPPPALDLAHPERKAEEPGDDS